MTKNNNKLVVGIVLVILAVALFAASGLDRVTLVGKWEWEDFDALFPTEYSAVVEEMDIKFYFVFGAFGDFKMDVDVPEEYEEEVKEQILQQFEEDDYKWSVNDGELLMSVDGEEAEGPDYTLENNSLTIEESGFEMSLKRADFLALHLIVKIISIALLVLGVVLIILKPKAKAAPAATTVGYSYEYSSASLCANCGNTMKPEDSFCQKCGHPKNPASAASSFGAEPEYNAQPSYEPTPTYEPTSVSEPAPAYDPTPVSEPNPYTTGGYEAKAEPEVKSDSDSGNWFNSAGDL